MSLPEQTGRKREGLFGAAALIMAVCCALLPAALGAGVGVAGTTGIVFAVIVAVSVAGVASVLMRRRAQSAC